MESMEDGLSTFRELFISDDEGSEGPLTPTSPLSSDSTPRGGGGPGFNLDFSTAKENFLDTLDTFREAAAPNKDLTPEFAAAVRAAADSLFGGDTDTESEEEV